MKHGSYHGAMGRTCVTVTWECHPNRKVITYRVEPVGIDDYISYTAKPERAEKFLKSYLLTRHGVEAKANGNGAK